MSGTEKALFRARIEYLYEDKTRLYLDDSNYQIYLECQRVCRSRVRDKSITPEKYMQALNKRMELDRLVQQMDDERINAARPGDACLSGLPEASDIGGHTSSDGV